jgi:hypothetical protein
MVMISISSGSSIFCSVVPICDFCPPEDLSRIQEYLADQLQLPVSEGSIYNFNQQAYEQLAEFETISKANLVASPYLHVDDRCAWYSVTTREISISNT